ncbi:hypothetical protein [Polyangium fumosum]|uniref:Uncharacterized protein n=1 Tax=Polyangium fumosum TaxID=889272 RepID=A0A4U1JJX3_9BACT|nr:hypothetical protein [Polyangium fumosum]TKD12289.1 hypothetical protein E8A74_04060 [Polyangium fumosum]
MANDHARRGRGPHSPAKPLPPHPATIGAPALAHPGVMNPAPAPRAVFQHRTIQRPPPHPATVQRSMSPHPATVQRSMSPHPATVQRSMPPHPATVIQRSVRLAPAPLCPHPAPAIGPALEPPPHPATMVQPKLAPHSALVVQRMMSRVDSGEEEEEEEEEEKLPVTPVQKLEWVKYGANQSETWHRVGKEWQSSKKKSKLHKLYWDDKHVRSERSFSPDRPKQVLRWLSTLLFAKYRKGEEIQSYYNTKTKTVVVSSNNNSVNAAIFRDIKNKTVLKINSSDLKTERQKRHVGKLLNKLEELYAPKKKLKDDEMNDVLKAIKDDEMNDVLKAIKKFEFEIPDPVEASRDGLHAERRIMAHVKGKDNLDMRYLGGVKRPCAVCTIALGLLGTARSGPLWPSQSALRGYSRDEIIKHFEENGKAPVTYVTLEKTTKKPTMKHDTDSDSD